MNPILSDIQAQQHRQELLRIAAERRRARAAPKRPNRLRALAVRLVGRPRPRTTHADVGRVASPAGGGAGGCEPAPCCA